MHLGDHDSARDLLYRSIGWFRRSRAVASAAYALDNTAALAANLGEPAGAARLLGAAARFRRELGMPIWESGKAVRARVKEVVIGHLGAERYEHLAAEGSALTFDDGCAEAMELLKSLGAPEPPEKTEATARV
jgi:hypothetical protein